MLDFLIIVLIVMSSFFGNEKWEQHLIFYEVTKRKIERIKKEKEE
jgi:hypothetical protein